MTTILFILSFAMATFLFSCDSKIKVGKSVPSAVVESAKQQPLESSEPEPSDSPIAHKLLDPECIDPDLAKVFSDTSLTLCDGNETSGSFTFDINPEMINLGQAIYGVEGTFSPDYPDLENVLSTDTAWGQQGLLTSCSTSDETGCYKSNLFSFSLVGSLDTSAQSIYAWGISKSGDFLYVNGGPNLGIIDVSDPANPSLRSNLATPSGQYSTSGIVVGPFWVICGGSVLVHVFDVSDLDTPTLAGTYDEAYGFCNEMIYGDGKLFVSTGNAQSEILKISDPTSPTRLGGHEGYGCGSCGPGSVFYKSDRMYLGYRDTYKEFRVLDVSDPTSPSLLGNYSNSGGVSGIVVVGDKAFLAANAEGLDIVDLSNLGAISRIHLMTFSEEVYKVVVYKKDILVVLGEDNVFLVDVSNPTSPDILTTYELPNGSMGNQGQALVDGDYIYVGSSGLLVVLKP